MTKYFIFLSALIFLSSCFTERIELALDDADQSLVITAWITNLDEPQFVTISRSVNFTGSEPVQTVSNAAVNISDEAATYQLTEAEAGKYYLPSDWQANVGDLYKLEVMLDGETYTAEHLMRSCPDIENLKFQEYNDDDLDSIFRYEILFSFQDPEGEGDAYYGVDYLKGTTAKDSLRNGGFGDDEFADGEYFDDINLSESDRLYALGQTAVVDLFSIGEETADYLTDIETEIFRDGPFDPPPSNVRTNISNGAIGYFIVSGARRSEILIE